MPLVRFGASAFDPDDLSAVAPLRGWIGHAADRLRVVVRGGTALDVGGGDADALRSFVASLPPYDAPVTVVSRPGHAGPAGPAVGKEGG